MSEHRDETPAMADRSDEGNGDPAAGPRTRAKRPLEVAMLLAESGFVALVLVEVLLRLTTSVAPPMEPRRFALVAPDGAAAPVRAVPVVDHGLPPGATLRFLYDAAGAPEHPYLVTDGAWQHLDAPLNPRGLRGPLPEQPKTRPRLACVGDSFTFGDGVPAADSWVARLRAAEPGLEVLNYGVPGFDVRDVADQIEARVLADTPDRILYAMTLNDVPVTGDADQTASAQRAQEEFRRSLAGPRGLARFSRLADLVQRRARGAAIDADYEAVIRASFDPAGPGWSALCDELDRLVELADRADAELVVALFPMMVALDGAYPFEEQHARVSSACAARGIRLVDLLPAFRGEAAGELWVHPTDQHPNPRGHELAAAALAEVVGEG